MTQEIEPGVIGKNISSLMLGPNYKHPISHEIFSNVSDLFIHINNIGLIPKNWKGNVWIWRSDRPFNMVDFSDTSYIREGDISHASRSGIL